VIEPQFSQAEPFSEGLAAVQAEMSGPVGYVDDTGKIVIEPGFYAAGAFSQGLAAVQLEKDGPVCYIDRNGTLIWPGH
jgi:hypothetical protein